MMDKTSPVISIITIVKNNQELLPRAVDSALAQSFSDLEHIIVNDGSTDQTTAIIDNYAEKDKRIKPKHMPHNVGRAMARNAYRSIAVVSFLVSQQAKNMLCVYWECTMESLCID